ncbi:MAG: hypothetical protein ACRD3W_23780, partial [Terriglobales bacterium]
AFSEQMLTNVVTEKKPAEIEGVVTKVSTATDEISIELKIPGTAWREPDALGKIRVTSAKEA